MICIFLAIVFSLLGGLVLGYIIAALLTIPVVFSFFFNYIPLAKIATIETFIEIGLIIYLILKKIFKRNKFFKVLGIIVIIFLTAMAIYISFRFKIIWTKDVPILGDLYANIYHFFSGMIDKILDFFG